MAGSKETAQKAMKTIYEKYGITSDGKSFFHVQAGKNGGMKGVGEEYQKGGKKASGFAANPERASYYGAYGGRKSRKRKTEIAGDSYYHTLLAKQRS